MNKLIILTAVLVSGFIFHAGYSLESKALDLAKQVHEIHSSNEMTEKEVFYKKSLFKIKGIPLLKAYSLLMNQVNDLESYSGTSMNVQLPNAKDANDISQYFVTTDYKRVKGLKLNIVINKFTESTDMGAVLDDVHLLEMNTDFLATQIIKEKDDLIVKGELYGL